MRQRPLGRHGLYLVKAIILAALCLLMLPLLPHPARAQNPPVPLYRLNNGNWYFLTANENEYNSLIVSGWTASPAPAGYVYLNSTDTTGLVPLYRLYYSGTGDHFYTTSADERAAVLGSGGWNDEGVAGYVFSAAVSGSAPLYRAYNAGTGDHLFTGAVSEYNGLSSAWTQEGIAAYTLASQPAPSYSPPGYSQAAYSGGAVTGGTNGDGPYAINSQNGQYGGSGAAMTSPGSPSILSGAITAQFTWSGGSANLPTPQSTILAQTCNVAWSCDGIASSKNTCTNPLGGSPTDWTESGGNGSSQTWDETTYSVLTNPGSPLAVTCTPYCYAGPADSFSYTDSSVFYTATVYPITISLAGTTPDPAASNAQKALTGQQVTATLNGIPANYNVTYSWSTTGATGGNPFKTWDPTWPNSTNPTQFVPLGPNDLNQSSFSFYDETSEKVYVNCTATITFPDGTTGTVTAQSQPVTFIKPTVSWTVNTPYGNESPGFFTGLPNGPFGVRELWGPIKITEPAPFAPDNVNASGTGCLVQIISTNRYWTRIPLNNQPATFSGVPVLYNDGTTANVTSPVGLDYGFPYPDGSILYDGSYTRINGDYAWAAINQGYSGDQPEQDYDYSLQDGGGNGWVYSFASDIFNTWVMYRPHSVGNQGAIYVPLQSMTWNWGGNASLAGLNFWAVTQDPTFNSDATTPSATDTYPSWTLSINGGF